MIPEEKRDAVQRALHEAFGVADFEDVSHMAMGSSKVVYRIVVRGCPYLLKFIVRTSEPARKIACMSAAAEAGLAPRVWYASAEDRVCVTDFVESAPVPPAEAAPLVASVLRALHALPPFPRVPDRINTSCTFLLNAGPGRDAFCQAFRAANIAPTQECDEAFDGLARIEAAYPRGTDMVSSHNDLKPENIRYDGRRVWLVDWEAAFLNDRYSDLAALAPYLVANDSDERAYLREYFGHDPDVYELARFFLAQQLSHLFYAMAYLLKGSAGKPIDADDLAPDFGAIHRGLWSGEISLLEREMQVAYGRAHWNRLLHNLGTPRFSDALRTVHA